MTGAGPVRVGDVLRHRTRWTDEEVAAWCRLAGVPDRPLPEHLPSLLVVAPLTRLGGEVDYVAGRMEWTAHRAVGRGEELVAELEVTRLEPAGDMVRIGFDARVLAGDGTVVTGVSRGVVLAPEVRRRDRDPA